MLIIMKHALLPALRRSGSGALIGIGVIYTAHWFRIGHTDVTDVADGLIAFAIYLVLGTVLEYRRTDKR